MNIAPGTLMTKDECNSIKSLAGRSGVPCEAKEHADDFEVFLGIENIQRAQGFLDYREAVAFLTSIASKPADLPSDALAVLLENDPG
jgi:hypothetical protein